MRINVEYNVSEYKDESNQVCYVPSISLGFPETSFGVVEFVAGVQFRKEKDAFEFIAMVNETLADNGRQSNSLKIVPEGTESDLHK